MFKRLSRLRAFLIGVALWFGMLGSPTSQALAAYQLYVLDSAPPGGTGSLQQPFNDIGTAVNAGRLLSASWGIIQINVAAGNYSVSSPIVIDYPLTLQGAAVLDFDLDGRPIGSVQTGTETRVTASATLGDNPVFYVRPKPGALSVAVINISRMMLKGSIAAPTSGALRLEKAQAFTVSDLVVNGAVTRVSPTAGIDVVASTGTLKRSFVAGHGSCGICVGAGTATSPAAVTLQQNRSKSNGAGGLLLSGTAFPLIEVSQGLTAQVLNNDLSDNSTGNQGFGIRTIAIGTTVPPPQTIGRVTAQFNGNRIANNRYALIVDAGFPRRNNLPLPSTSCLDTRTFGGQLTLQLNANSVSGSIVSPALVTTTRAQVWLAPANNPIAGWQYLHGASVLIQDPSLSLGGYGAFRYEHPQADTFVNASGGGFCANDVSPELLGNLVIYNSNILPYGRNF